MNIGFEAKRFFSNYTGLGNYCRFVVDALTDYKPNSSFFLYAPWASNNREVNKILEKDNISIITPSQIYSKLRLNALWRSYGVSLHPTFKDLNIYHGLSQELPVAIPANVKKVVTVHDLIFLRYPQFYSRVDAMIYKLKAESACNMADRIIAISQQTADDISNYFNIPSEKISVVYQGCHSNFKRSFTPDEIIRIREKYQLPSSYILNVGTIEERKNLMLVVKALALLPEPDRVPLVVIGRRTSYYEQVVQKAKELKVLKNIIFLSNVSFDELPAIYQGAKVFVYPSLFEGFGIPLVEAISSNVPVITSTGSCFSEAAGPDSIYVDPNNEEALAHAISRVTGDDVLSNNMRERSRDYIKRFQKQVIAGNLFDIYQQL